jgi:hypothetical protein
MRKKRRKSVRLGFNQSLAHVHPIELVSCIMDGEASDRSAKKRMEEEELTESPVIVPRPDSGDDGDLPAVVLLAGDPLGFLHEQRSNTLIDTQQNGQH